ncbi:MAG TPA: zf-HC2 domain-containing protein [Microlunatus sp.]|nr:zf-HC2 domain-containing protein [Microlunatus sp.]
MSHDRFASFDAAYVLGALSPRERQEYEHHLRECADCAQAVRELAGMPGLLSRVPPSLVPAEDGPAGADGDPAPPADSLDRLLVRARAERLRSRLITAGSAVLAVAACVALAVVIVIRPPAGAQPTPVPTATMSSLSNAPVLATVGFEPVDWGTKVNMYCMYERRTGSNRGGVYLLVLIAKDGTVEQLGSWTVTPGREAKLQAATSRALADIDAVEIRTASGRPLLEIHP